MRIFRVQQAGCKTNPYTRSLSGHKRREFYILPCVARQGTGRDSRISWTGQVTKRTIRVRETRPTYSYAWGVLAAATRPIPASHIHTKDTQLRSMRAMPEHRYELGKHHTLFSLSVHICLNITSFGNPKPRAI